jgi:hypothetical protein
LPTLIVWADAGAMHAAATRSAAPIARDILIIATSIVW